jgi:hypothetical protein
MTAVANQTDESLNGNQEATLGRKTSNQPSKELLMYRFNIQKRKWKSQETEKGRNEKKPKNQITHNQIIDDID